ncbi:MAG TPA: ACT domain-containing protein [Candidatus Limnocylindria bacterium]|nr:ACT domain-containing protein [Candidatus Limnocylindria bacterium]
MTKELRVSLPDRPGSLAKLAEALGSAGVNIESLAASTAGGSGDIRVITAEPDKAKAALDQAGIAVSGEREVVTLDLEHRPGSLATAARKLADAGVNIDAVYVVGETSGKKRLALGVADAAKAKKALGL